MELFDTHFHYYADRGTPEAYRRRIGEDIGRCAPELRPEKMYLLAAGADYAESLAARDFAGAVGDCWYAAGVHPHSADAFLADRRDFGELLAGGKCVAAGEIGLDYFYDNSDRANQRRVFEFFLGLALERKLPAIVHLRDRDGVFDAYADGLALLGDYAASGGRMVIHCFSGTPEWAEKALALGAFLGVTGIVTFPRATNIRETLAVIPDDRLLIETDAPYLAPVPFRGKENSPGFLPNVAAKIAAERGVPAAEIAGLTTANAFRFFGLHRS